MKKIISILMCVSICAGASGQTFKSHWNGCTVAYLGDSITDANQIGNTNDTYWNILVDMMGIKPLVYGINGHQMNQIVGQSEKLTEEHGQDFDAIMVFVGTNDFNASVPIGHWFDFDTREVSRDGEMKMLAHRTHNFDPETFCGRTNTVMNYLKHEFPAKQIILVTPIHRAYARFDKYNEQPDESYANEAGEYIDAYVECIKQAGNIWSVPVIDLNADCGLYPLDSAYSRYFRDSERDMLHPNTEGHRRMALAIACRLTGIPVF